MDIYILAVILVLITTGLIFFLRDKKKARKLSKDMEDEGTKAAKRKNSKEETKEKGPPKKGIKQLIKEQEKAKGHGKFKARRDNPSHELFVDSLKGFSGPVVDWDISYSEIDERIVAIQQDLVHLYSMKDIEDNGIVHSFMKVEYSKLTSVSIVEKDAKLLKWTVAVACEDDSAIKIFDCGFDISRKNYALTPANGLNHITKAHKSQISVIRFSKLFTRYLVSCGSENDTKIKLWNIAGNSNEPVSEADTKQLKNKEMVGSTGEYFSTIAWTPEIKVYRILTDKSGEPKGQLEKIMDMLGHKGEVYSVNFSSNVKRSVTSAQDGTIKLWKVDVEYKLKEDPKLIATKDLSKDKDFPAARCCAVHVLVNPDDYRQEKVIVAAAYNKTLKIFEGDKFIEVATIGDAHLDDIKRIEFYENSKTKKLYLLSCSPREGRINIWKMPFGFDEK